MIKAIMRACGMTKEEAEEQLQDSLEFARENYFSDGNLNQAVEDCLSDLGLDSDYTMQIANMIAFGE